MPRRCACARPRAWPIAPPQPSRSHAGDTTDAATPPSLRGGRRRGRGARPGRARATSPAGRSPQAGDQRARGGRARARGRASSRRAAPRPPRRRRARAGQARPSQRHRRTRPGKFDRGHRSRSRARAAGRAAGRGPPDQRSDRRRAVPQPEDGRDAPAQPLPQARRVSRVEVARAVERADRAEPYPEIRVPDQGVVPCRRAPVGEARSVENSNQRRPNGKVSLSTRRLGVPEPPPRGGDGLLDAGGW